MLADVYSARPLPIEQHTIISLVLHKVVDAWQDVRDAARGLLRMLARRAWGRDTRFSEQDGAGAELQVRCKPRLSRKTLAASLWHGTLPAAC